MRLETIKLAGFKSFVDPISIPLPSNLVGIVGPNGCGKSNIIDAIRWVMGESSAKHLRGDSMADVIFNGATSRQPVSMASVELVFDNTDQRVGGEFAQYNQLSVKRRVTREGQSTYFLNNARCRRKDVTDIFLGTGLGPRSYAIIEQGTISRLIEAKPDELRVFIEEAAGISRYKERRRETEMRMRNTQENLDRLNDLTDEVSQQLRNLERQVKKAEHYTLFKQHHRDCQQQLLAMRWQRYNQLLKGEEANIETLDCRLKDELAALHNTEDNSRETRQQLVTQQQLASSTQEHYYTLSADITRIEQILKHNQASQQALEDDHARMLITHEQAAAHVQQDRSQLQQLAEEQQKTETDLQKAKILGAERQQQADDLHAANDDWQQQWEEVQTELAHCREQRHIQHARIQQLNAQQQQTDQTLHRLKCEQTELSRSDLQQETTRLQGTVEMLEQQNQVLQNESQQLDTQIQKQKQYIKQLGQPLDLLRSQEQKNQGKIASLELLQKQAMGNSGLTAWLQTMGLQEATRLAEHLQVDSGWEIAVETVLDTHLQAICINNCSTGTIVEHLAKLNKATVAVFDTTETLLEPDQVKKEHLLLSKVRAPWSLTPLLSTIYCAENLSAALKIRPNLTEYESVISADGVWLGRGWAMSRRGGSETSGVLERGQALRELKTAQKQLDSKVNLLQQQEEQAETSLVEAESRQSRLRQRNQQLHHQLTTQNSLLSSQQAHLQQTQKRLQQLQTELQEVDQQQTRQANNLSEAIGLHDEAEQQRPELEQHKNELQETQQQFKLRNDEINNSLGEARQTVQELTVCLQTLTTSRTLTKKNLHRVEQQYQEALARIEAIAIQRAQLTSPGDDETAKLEPLRHSRNQQQHQLTEIKTQISRLEQSIEQLVQQQSEREDKIETVRKQLETLRMERQTHRVHRQTIEEQLESFTISPIEAVKHVPKDATETEWEIRSESLQKKIQRLGAVNLVAVDQYKTQSERHQLLQEQHADLTESLALLASAIAKIDKESQLLFKDTFERVNEGLKSRFPKLFAGGQAYLQLEGEDLLESGVKIMARPPGKRNSSIHLLSGGEKALTAIALVFAIFDLNPAPFCILDEVDAPLDDANVVRFCQLVEEMSETIQFIYITHNKVTMEISKHLAGVTQKELGVSRMVSVDIDEAIELAAV